MRVALLLAAMTLSGAAQAQGPSVVTSDRPDKVEVTIYRDPDRGSAAMDLGMLNGFALVSERRRITLPAGQSTIRFEGVAGGIVPQSAIVTGFPDGIVERNRDAYLLSPGTLLDRSLGRRVHLRRTDLATGAVREHDAVVRSGADGAVVLQTADGIEALRCSGLPEMPVYDELPPGLSSRPTFSVVARAAAPVEAEATLSYLATGFDWQADYIVELSDDGRRMKLFAWMTLASTDETSFPDADTQAVAGQVNYTDADVPAAEGPALILRCWPHATTSDIPLEQFERLAMGTIAYPSAVPGGSEMIVTAQRRTAESMASMSPVTAITAEREQLGDLKLYRIPEPMTLAANSQKQVALLVHDDIPVRTVYRGRVSPYADEDPEPSRRILVTRNRTRENLGVPLPAGGVSAYVRRAGAPFLIGEGYVGDRAVGEDVEIVIGESPGVWYHQQSVAKDEARGWEDFLLTVTNDQARPIQFEAELRQFDDIRTVRPRLPERDGMRIWAVTVPANGTRTLRYRVQEIEPDDE